MMFYSLTSTAVLIYYTTNPAQDYLTTQGQDIFYKPYSKSYIAQVIFYKIYSTSYILEVIFYK